MENHELVELIKKRKGKASLRAFATEIGLSAAYLSDVFRGNRAVGPRLAVLMGYVPVTHISFRNKEKNG